MYADVYVYLRSGSHRGGYAVYERFTTYELLEDGVPQESGAGDLESTERNVGSEPNPEQGVQPGQTNNCVNDANKGGVSEGNDERGGSEAGNGADVEGQNKATPEQLPLVFGDGSDKGDRPRDSSIDF